MSTADVVMDCTSRCLVECGPVAGPSVLFPGSLRAAQVLELLGIADRTNGLDLVLGNVQRDRHDESSIVVVEQGSRLAVHLGEAKVGHAETGAAARGRHHEPRALLPSVNRARECGRPSSAV